MESEFHEEDEFAHGIRVVGPAELFSKLGDQLPGWYAKRYLTAKEAAKFLGIDHSTVREQARAGRLKGRLANGVWRFGIRDLSDYIAGGHWHGTRLVRPWTQGDIEELLATGTCRGRTEVAIKAMKIRLKKRYSAPSGRWRASGGSR